jgi:hypothetical protein
MHREKREAKGKKATREEERKIKCHKGTTQGRQN